MTRKLKSRHRCHELALPFVIPHTPIVWCVQFCMSCINLQPNASSTARVGPHDKFSGIKLDAKRDRRVAFGDYVLATTAYTNNSIAPRAEPGNVWMLSLKTNNFVTREQFVHLPMPAIVIDKLTRQTLWQGYSRGEDPTIECPTVIDEDDDYEFLPGMMDIDGRANDLPRARPQDAIGSEDLAPSAKVSASAIIQDTGSPIASEPHTAQPISRELRALH